MEMNFYSVSRIKAPYDVRSLIEVYVYSRRSFVHEDFAKYYQGLLATLERLFEVRLHPEGLPFEKEVLWSLFEGTARSLLRVGSPWDEYLESSLLASTLRRSGEPGRVVFAASDKIEKANAASEAAHREMLLALFEAMFGPSGKTFTSQDLAAAGFDDSKEPQTSDYHDHF
jgi:hypothetical protein